MKRIISLCLALVMVLPLCACGGSSGGGWEVTQRPDEFGEVTANSPTMVSTSVEGEYSSKEVSSGDLVVNISFQKKENIPLYFVEFELLEDGTINAVYEEIIMQKDVPVLKTKVGETVTEYYLDAASPNTNVYLSLLASPVDFNEKDYFGGNTLFRELYNGSDIQCIIYFYSSGKQYNFTIKSENFAEICSGTDFALGPVNVDEHTELLKAEDVALSSELNIAEAIEIIVRDDSARIGAAELCIIQNMSNYEVLSGTDIEDALNGLNITVYGPRHNPPTVAELNGVMYYKPYNCSPYNWHYWEYDLNSHTRTTLNVIELNAAERVFKGKDGTTRNMIILGDTYWTANQADAPRPAYGVEQLLKVTDNIYITTFTTSDSPNTFEYLNLVFKCPDNISHDIASGTSAEEIANYICTELIPEIE